MDALDRSDELRRRGEKLRARSVQLRVAADETMDKSRRLIAAARKAHESVLHAHGWELARPPNIARGRGGL